MNEPEVIRLPTGQVARLRLVPDPAATAAWRRTVEELQGIRQRQAEARAAAEEREAGTP